TAGFFLADRWRQTSAEARQAGERLRDFLASGPPGLSQDQLDQLGRTLLAWLRGHREGLTSALAQGTVVTVQVLAGLVLTLFVAFFLLLDGERIWEATVRHLPAARRERVGRA